MIKKVITGLLIELALIFLITQTVYGAITIIETSTEKEILEAIDSSKDNPLTDKEVKEIEKKVDEKLEENFEIELGNVDIHIDKKYLEKQPEINKILEKYEFSKDAATNKEEIQKDIAGEMKKETKEKNKKSAKEYWNENKDRIRDGAVAEIKKRGTKYIDEYSKILVEKSFEPIYNSISEQINDTIPLLGTVCANLAKRYADSFQIDILVANEIKRNVGLEIKKYEAKKFDWGDAAIRAGMDAIQSEATRLVTDIVNRGSEELIKFLGMNPNETQVDEAITKYVGTIVANHVGNWCSNAYNTLTGKNAYDEMYNKAMKTAIDEVGKEMAEKMTEDISAKVKETLEEQRKEAEKKYANAKNDALNFVAEAIGDLASNYAMSIYEGLQDRLDEFGKKFGKFGNIVINGLSNQVKTWIGTNIANAVTTYLKNMFFNKNDSINWSNFDIDWTRLGVNVLATFLLDQELAELVDTAYGLISGIGGIVSGPVPFETYSKLYFMFALRVPTETTATTASTAITAATIGMDVGNEGIASDMYSPTQFNTLSDNLLISIAGVSDALKFSILHLETIGSPTSIMVEPTAKTISYFVPLWTTVFVPRSSFMGRYCIYIM